MMPACYVYPLVMQATEITKDLVAEFELPGSLAVSLKRSIDKRFNCSQSARILKLLFYSTPIGRQSFREFPETGAVIHGRDKCRIDDSIIIFNITAKDLHTLDVLRKDANKYLEEGKTL